MAQTFRSAFNGFNREDVAHYIEYITGKHNAELSELRSQVALLQAQLDSAPAQPADTADLAAENEALREKVAQLEMQLLAAPAPQPASADQELEAYRRAERTERLARERAENICRQTNTLLTDATGKVDDASARIAAITDQVRQQLDLLQHAVGSSRQALQDAAATMYSMTISDSTDN